MSKRTIFLLSVLFVALSSGIGYTYHAKTAEKESSPATLTVTTADDNPKFFGKCNVAGVLIRGTIVIDGNPWGSSMDLFKIFEEIKMNDSYKAVLFDVDSGGGSAVAGDEIAAMVHRIGKLKVAAVHSVAASAAYQIVSATDVIFAPPNSTVGSIGVFSVKVDETEKNKKEGVKIDVIRSRKNKGTWHPAVPMTEEQRAMEQEEVERTHEIFVSSVAKYRKKPREQIAEIADGRGIRGDEGLKLGLVDHVGYFFEAHEYIAKQLGEEVKICWLNK